LHSRNQQRDENANDRDHDQQFDKRERFAFTLVHCPESVEGQFDEREATPRLPRTFAASRLRKHFYHRSMLAFDSNRGRQHRMRLQTGENTSFAVVRL
jgi:hypothetical protein